jgi:hypothetical protein
MKCPNCSSQVPTTSRFCDSCGRSLPDEPEISEAQAPARAKAVTWSGLGALVLLAGVGVCAYFLFFVSAAATGPSPTASEPAIGGFASRQGGILLGAIVVVVGGLVTVLGNRR